MMFLLVFSCECFLQMRRLALLGEVLVGWRLRKIHLGGLPGLPARVFALRLESCVWWEHLKSSSTSLTEFGDTSRKIVLTLAVFVETVCLQEYRSNICMSWEDRGGTVLALWAQATHDASRPPHHLFGFTGNGKGPIHGKQVS